MATIKQHVDFKIQKSTGKLTTCPMCGRKLSPRDNNFAIQLPNGVFGHINGVDYSFNLPKGSKCVMVGTACFSKLNPVVMNGELINETFKIA